MEGPQPTRTRFETLKPFFVSYQLQKGEKNTLQKLNLVYVIDYDSRYHYL